MRWTHRERLALIAVEVESNADDCVLVVSIGNRTSEELVAVTSKTLESERGAGAHIQICTNRRHAVRGPGTLEIIAGLSGWAVTSAAWDMTKLLAFAFAREVAGSGISAQSTRFSPLTDVEAVGRATWIVEQRYNENVTDLHTSEVDLTDVTAKVILDGQRGQYTVWLEVHDELVLVARVRRATR